MTYVFAWLAVIGGVLLAVCTVFLTWAGNDLIISAVLMLLALALVVLGIRSLLTE